MTDTFVVDLASGPYFTLPKYTIGGKLINFSGQMIAYDQLYGGVAPRLPNGQNIKQMLRDAQPDFFSLSAFAAASYDNYDPVGDITQGQWRALLDAQLMIVDDGGAIVPGFTAHGITAPIVMGSYPSPTYPPELVTNIPATSNPFSREQAGKYLLNTIIPRLGGDLSKLLPAEISNEPATNNPQQYGDGSKGTGPLPSGKGWYDDPLPSARQGTIEEDFHTNIVPHWNDYLAGLVAGYGVQAYSYAFGARAGQEEINSLTRFINCYSGSRQWQASSGSKNLGHFKWLALHGYTQISTGLIAGANKNDPQQAWNTIFHTTTPYDITKDGMVGGFREKRRLLDQLGGSNIPFFFSEQWLIAGSGNTQNSIQAMADVLGFIATMQNASSWFVGGQGGYSVHCINPGNFGTAYDASTSWPEPNDLMFGVQLIGGNIAHATGRYYTFKDMLCAFGNRNGYQRLLPVTTTAVSTPATVLSNAVPWLQGCAGLNAAGTQMAFLVANVDMTNSHTATFSWTGSASTGTATGKKWVGGGTTPLDTGLSTLAGLPGSGVNSFSLTLAAGDCAIIYIPVGASSVTNPPSNLQPPAISGVTTVGGVLTFDDGLWTNTPTSTPSRTLYLCDPNGVVLSSRGALADGATYTTVTGDIGSTFRVGVVKANAGGSSNGGVETLSNPTGIITAAMSGGSSVPTLTGTPVVSVTFASSYSGSITVPSMTSGLMMFHFHRKLDSDMITAVSLNSVTMTGLGTQTDGGHSIATEVWYMVAPPAGAYTFAWTKSGSPQNLGWSVQFWDNVNQAAPFTSPPLETGDGGASGQTATGSLAVSANDVVVTAATFNIAAADPTHGSGQTNLYATHQSTTQISSSYKTASTGGTITVSESASAPAANYAMLAYLIHGNTAGSAPVNSSSPVVTGAAVEQQLLTSTSGSWNDQTATFTWRYEKANPDGSSITTIRAASSDPTYTIAVGVSGSIVRAVAIATNGFGSNEAPSQWTATVTSPGLMTPPSNTTAPVASGPVAIGGQLAVDTGVYEASHPPITYTYEWRRKN